MSDSPRRPYAHLLEDPRFEATLRKAMGKHGLMPFVRYTVVQLLSGETDPASLTCCDSGCRPCNKQILGCVDTVVRKLSKPRRRFLFFRAPEGRDA